MHFAVTALCVLKPLFSCVWDKTVLHVIPIDFLVAVETGSATMLHERHSTLCTCDVLPVSYRSKRNQRTVGHETKKKPESDVIRRQFYLT